MNQKVTIKYTNWKGEKSQREIIPKLIEFTSNQWHPEEQWILVAYDCDKNEERNFAMRDIEEWD